MRYTLHNADCTDILPGDYAGKVDLIVTSPPYDSMRTYDGHKFNFKRVADALVPCLKDGGVIVWVVADQIIDHGESGTSFKHALGFMERGLLLHQTLIYKNSGGRPITPDRCLRDIQYMFVFSKGRPKTANMPVDRKNISAGTTRKSNDAGRKPNDKKGKDQPWSRRGHYTLAEYGRRTQVWEYPTGLFHAGMQETHQLVSDIHPAIFPIKLAYDHILCWSNPGDLVLDPMAGSGTTLSAAIEAGREAHGIEIAARYCAGAHERLSKEHDGMLAFKAPRGDTGASQTTIL